MQLSLAMNFDKANNSLAIISLTPKGNQLSLRIARLIPCDCYTTKRLAKSGLHPFADSFAQTIATLFSSYSSLLFICATGIVVRTIAPLLQSKLTDPAVLVMDEQGQHIISLLSGHIGGANRLTLYLANLVNAQPVITTATDVNQVAALDMIALQMNAAIVNYRSSVIMINLMLVSGKRVGLYQQHAHVDDQRGFIVIDNLQQIQTKKLDALVWISMDEQLPSMDLPVVQVVPRRIVAGIGCKRATCHQLLYEQLCDQFSVNRLHLQALQKIGSIEIKKDEKGLIDLAEQLKVPFELYTVDQLKPYESLFPQSLFVKQTLGIGSVSQPVAWLMSHGHLRGETLKQHGITITLGVTSCCM